MPIMKYSTRPPLRENSAELHTICVVKDEDCAPVTQIDLYSAAPQENYRPTYKKLFGTLYGLLKCYQSQTIHQPTLDIEDGTSPKSVYVRIF